MWYNLLGWKEKKREGASAGCYHANLKKKKKLESGELLLEWVNIDI